MNFESIKRKLSPLTLGLAFLLASASVTPRGRAAEMPDGPKTENTPAAAPNAQTGHSYWNLKDYGVILDTWNCADSGICMKVESVDPANAKIKKFLGDRVLKKKAAAVTAEDMGRLCGFQPELVVTGAPGPDAVTGVLGKWKGRVMVPFEKMTGKEAPDHRLYGIEIEDRITADKQEVLHIHGFWAKPWPLSAIVGGSVDLTLAANPPAACIVPPPSPRGLP